MRSPEESPLGAGGFGAEARQAMYRRVDYLIEEDLAAGAAGARGGQPIYSSIAIETGGALRLVFHQPLRQTEGLLRSIADVLGISIAIPDHTALGRGGGGLTILPKHIDRAEP